MRNSSIPGDKALRRQLADADGELECPRCGSSMTLDRDSMTLECVPCRRRGVAVVSYDGRGVAPIRAERGARRPV